MANNVLNESKELKEETEKKEVVKKKTNNKKTETKGANKKVQNDRLTDVIEKMEEETKKVQVKAKNESKEKNRTSQSKKVSRTTKNKETSKVSENKKGNKSSQNKKENKTIRNREVSKSSQNEEGNKSLKVSKNQENKISTEVKELETIEKEIKKQTIIPKEKMNKIYAKVFENILYAMVILLYFILINIGSTSIRQDIFITDLKVFSITSIIVTICVFEYAYKKESGKYTIHGIELLILSICTLLSIRIYTIYNRKFISAIASIALLFAIYYVGKSIIIYVKEKKKAKKITNDIFKISKKK